MYVGLYNHTVAATSRERYVSGDKEGGKKAVMSKVGCQYTEGPGREVCVLRV